MITLEELDEVAPESIARAITGVNGCCHAILCIDAVLTVLTVLPLC